MAWMTAWIKKTHSSIWEWTMHGWDDNGTEVHLQRRVVNLEDSAALSLQHIASVPNACLLKTIEIQILEYRAHDRLYM